LPRHLSELHTLKELEAAVVVLVVAGPVLVLVLEGVLPVAVRAEPVLVVQEQVVGGPVPAAGILLAAQEQGASGLILTFASRFNERPCEC
jgi:hypothetical protein